VGVPHLQRDLVAIFFLQFTSRRVHTAALSRLQ
jgi:hypothetical protein